jgi:hypothetical protein
VPDNQANVKEKLAKGPSSNINIEAIRKELECAVSGETEESCKAK